MANRCISIIEALERESREVDRADHERRLDRLQRSSDVYCAAMAEANEHGVTLTHDVTCYTLSDERHIVWFYPATNHAMRKLFGESRSQSIELHGEFDIAEITSLFCEGAFLK